ncbi:MAG: sensor histidine kinase, partial [Bacteroidota bacterium]
MSNSPLSVLKFKIIFITCWLVLMTDHVLVLHWLELPWKASIIDSAISNGILLLACLLVMNTLRFYLPQRDQYINIFVWCVLLT